MKPNPTQFAIDDELEGFRIKAIDFLPKSSNTMIQLEHLLTGATMIHLANEDDENCFGIGFRTNPKDSTGVAHILEHTALCGSEKYPVRDPFFSMTRRSMKTFMNAFTASDWTMYPFASQNETDFFNLMHIYLDAAFFPTLSELDFRQEGHRLEFEPGDNSSGDLTIKGIVYNEMKGAMSSQSQIMHRNLAEALYPSTTYHFNSGGDPEKITELSYKQLKEFHKTHYHPSNALIFTYGNFPLEKNLRIIHENALSRFEKQKVYTSVPLEKRYDKPRDFQYTYSKNKSEVDDKDSQVSLAWLTCSIDEPLEILSLQVINLILLGHSGSILRKNLLESKLGKALSDTTGFESENRESYFSAGLRGVAPADVDQVEQIILDTLKDVVAQGIPEMQVESAIHQMELDTREIGGGHYPNAISILFRFFGTWMHGGDPVKAIDFDSTMEKLRDQIEKGPYLEDQIKKYLIHNPHRVKVVLHSEESLEEKREEKLKQKLHDLKEAMSKNEKEALVQQADLLKKHQEKDEDLSVLPSLSVSDIPKNIKFVDPTIVGHQGKDLTFYDCATNGIVYFNWSFPIHQISEEDRLWLPLLGMLLPSVGVGEQAYDDISEQYNLLTGGFSAAPGIARDFNQGETSIEAFSFSTKALYRNQNKMLDLAGQMLTAFRFDEIDRIQTLIQQRTTYTIQSVMQSGHSYAASSAKRAFSRISSIDEIYSGIQQVQFLKHLATLPVDKLKQQLDYFQHLIHQIFDPSKIRIVIAGNGKEFTSLEKSIAEFRDRLSEKYQSLENTSISKEIQSDDLYKPQLQNEAWMTSTPVSYVVQSRMSADFLHKDSGSLQVLSKLLQSCYIHGELREKGGAYGGMVSYQSEEGVFSMISYRDPHLLRTINIYEGARNWLEKGDFTQQEVDEAILQTCSAMDSPMPPAMKAICEYNFDRRGKTREMRETFRRNILSCTREQLIQVGKEMLALKPSLSAVTSESILNREDNTMKDHPLERREV